MRASIGGTIDVNAQLQTPASRQVATDAVANRNKGGRARSRKRRRAAATAGAPSAGARTASPGEADTEQQDESAVKQAPSGSRKRERPRGAAQRSAGVGKGSEARTGSGGFRDPQSLGERPEPPWHPLPLSELLILVGAVGTVIGLSRGVSHGGAPLVAGLAAVVIGTAEVTWREHVSGYRSHTLILALLPTLVFHSAVVLIVAAFTSTPRALNIGLLVIDAGLFAFLFKLLRARFQDARRERVFAGKR
jgi:hypothetical protein